MSLARREEIGVVHRNRGGEPRRFEEGEALLDGIRIQQVNGDAAALHVLDDSEHGLIESWWEQQNSGPFKSRQIVLDRT